MLWDIDGVKVDPSGFGPLHEGRCLIEYEGPRTFLSNGLHGELFLLHQCDEDGEYWSYFVVPISNNILQWLEDGMIDLHTVLNLKPAWVVTFDNQGVKSVYLLHSLKNAENRIPKPGIMLYEPGEKDVV